MNYRWMLYLRTTDNPKNHEFISWITGKWREWEHINNLPAHCHKTSEMHKQFDRWLEDVTTCTV